MKRILNTKGLSNKEWLEQRRLLGVGGSEASIIMGHNKYKSVQLLFDEKTNVVPVNEVENKFTHFGHVLEDVIRKEFIERTGLKVRRVNAILRCEKTDHEFMFANVDGIVTETDGSKAIFEAKTASEYRREEIQAGVPQEYIDQVFHYMICLNLKKAYVAFLVGGNTFIVHTVDYDEEYAEILCRKEKEFWECVTSGTRPEIDGSEATADYLADKYSDVVEDSEVTLPDEAIDLIETCEKVDKEIKSLKGLKDTAVNGLKLLLGENERGTANNGKVVSWKSITRRDLNRTALKEALGEAFDGYLKETSYRKFEIA